MASSKKPLTAWTRSEVVAFLELFLLVFTLHNRDKPERNNLLSVSEKERFELAEKLRS